MVNAEAGHGDMLHQLGTRTDSPASHLVSVVPHGEQLGGHQDLQQRKAHPKGACGNRGGC